MAGAAGLAGFLPENLARAATSEPPGVRPVAGQAPGLPDAGEPLASTTTSAPSPARADSTTRPRSGCPTAGRSSSSPTRPTPTATSSRGTCPPSPPAPPRSRRCRHDWRDQHASWNQGAMDGWLLTHVASDGDDQRLVHHGLLRRRRTSPSTGRWPRRSPCATTTTARSWARPTPTGSSGKRAATTRRARPAARSSRPAACEDLTYESGAETLYNAGISYKFYQAIGWPQDTISLYFKQFQTPGLVPDRALQRGDVDRHAVGRRHAGRDRRPGEPDAGHQPGAGLRGGLRQRRAARRVVHRVQVRLRRAPAGHPGGRRPVPRDQAGGPGRQRGPVEHARSSSSTTTRTTGSSTTWSRRRRTRPSTPRSSSPWRRRPGTPGGGLPDRRRLPGPCFVISPWSVGRPDLLRGLRPHLLPAADRVGRGGRRPVRAPGRSPSPTSAAGGARRSATGPGPCARSRGRRRRRTPSSTPATTAANLTAQTAAALLPLPKRPGADQQTSFTLSPTSGLVLAPGASATVAATFSNNGPGSFRKVEIALSGAPSGWKVTAAAATTASSPGRRIVAHGIVDRSPRRRARARRSRR